MLSSNVTAVALARLLEMLEKCASSPSFSLDTIDDALAFGSPSDSPGIGSKLSP